MIYLDNAATGKMKKEVLDEMIPYFISEYENASSIYRRGKELNKLVEMCRENISKSINANSGEIYFTSGGSEADNWAIKGVVIPRKEKGKHIITTKIEHPAVIETCKYLEKNGYEVTYLSVNEEGLIELDELENSIREDTILVSIMFANNEIGTIEPIKEIGSICKKHNVLFHTDAVQAYGNVNIDVKDMNIDLLSVSAHKIGGPKGIGFLYVRKGVLIDNLIHGGHQERGKRAGTTNTPLIIGFNKALELKLNDYDKKNEYITNLRDYLIEKIEKEIPYSKLNGSRINRLPGNVNFSFRFIEGEGMLLKLDSKGIMASSGSACTSGSLDPSHVLLAIGLPHEIAHGSLRLTISEDNTKEEIDYLVDNLKEIIEYLRNMSPLYEDFLKKEGK